MPLTKDQHNPIAVLRTPPLVLTIASFLLNSLLQSGPHQMLATVEGSPAPHLDRALIINEPPALAAALAAASGLEAISFSGAAPNSTLNHGTSTTTTTSASNGAQNASGQHAKQVVIEPLVIDASQQVIAPASQAPKSDKQSILEMFARFFTRARSHDDQQQKEYVREGVIRRMRELGFETSFLQKSRFEFRKRPATSYNMISVLPGRYRQTKHDRIVVIGAHWDSATKAPGVDDNGSGSTCLLEIARLISANQCKFNHTVMLVWFDYEEQGKFGSEFFVNDYLFPLELDKYGSRFIGAYIMDMILVRDKENNTQTLPLNLKTKLTEFTEELESEKNRGDFLATWARRIYDEPLEAAFRDSWVDLGYEARTFKSMRPDLPQLRLPNSYERYEWKDFFRSDHASFWFPPMTSTAVRRSPNRTSLIGHSSLNAILLTDLGPWRKSYSKCYHSVCDDEHLLTDDNIAFMQQVTDALVLTLLRVGQGECSSTSQPPSPSLISPVTTPPPMPTPTPTPAQTQPQPVQSSSASPAYKKLFADVERRLDQITALSSATSYVTIESPNFEQSSSSLSSSLSSSSSSISSSSQSTNATASVASSVTTSSTTTTTTTTKTTDAAPEPPSVFQMPPAAAQVQSTTTTTPQSSSPSSPSKASGAVDGPCVDGKNCATEAQQVAQPSPKSVAGGEPCQAHATPGANCISMAQAH